MPKRKWGLNEWALAAAIFGSAASGVGIVWQWLSGGKRVFDGHIVKVVVESPKVDDHIVKVVRDSLR